MNHAQSNEMQALLARWEIAKKALPAAAIVVKAEQDLRKQVIAAAFPTPAEGVNTLELANGWKLKASCPVTRTIDEAAFNLLKPKLAELGIIADSLVRYKVELETKNYKGMSDAGRAFFDQVLTIKPGSNTLELVAPAAK